MNKKRNILSDVFIYRYPGINNVEEKAKIWEIFCSEYNGKLKRIHDKSRAFLRLKMEIPFKNYTVIFAESDLKPLKIKCSNYVLWI